MDHGLAVSAVRLSVTSGCLHDGYRIGDRRRPTGRCGLGRTLDLRITSFSFSCSRTTNLARCRFCELTVAR